MPTTWTYDATDLATSEKDQVRLLVGDTDSGAWLLADQEIQHALDTSRNTWSAAAQCAENIGFLFMRRVDVKLGRAMQVTYSKMAKQYFELAKWMRQKSMASGGVVPYVGGAYIADKLAIGENDALVAPLFTKTMMQNPWTGGYTSDSLGPVSNDPDFDADED